MSDDTDYSYLNDASEREWLTSVSPIDVLKNAHRIYDFMAEGGLPPESFIRELAFTKASQALNISYEVLYQAWLNEMPVGPAAMRRARATVEHAPMCTGIHGPGEACSR